MASDAEYDYIVVGAGPAGVQMGYFLQKAGRRYVILERNSAPGSFYETNPRHRTLISINKRFNFFEEDEFNLRHDWNSLISDNRDMRFTKYTEELFPNADHLVKYIADYVREFNINIVYDTSVKHVSKNAGVFSVETSGKTYKSQVVFMATGALAEYKPTDVKGLEHADSYSTHTLDRSKYNNKRVCVVGGGNSGFEVADYLAGHASLLHIYFGNKELKMAWNSHYVGDLRAVNNTIIDMYHLKSMHSLFGSKVTEIEPQANGTFMVRGVDLVTHWPKPGWLKFAIEYDNVITCTGWSYVDKDLFDPEICPDTIRNGRYPRLTDSWETRTPGLYYMGAAMAGDDRQSASGFIHGFRYNVRSLFNIAEMRYHNVPLPHVDLGPNLEAIAKRIIWRASINDAMYQMNSRICDVVAVKGDEVKYYDSVPVPFVRKNWRLLGEDIYVLLLNYGFDKFEAEPLKHTHVPDYTNNKCVPFLHPFIERVVKGEVVDCLEIHESLVMRYDKAAEILPQWTEKVNENYLMDYFNKHQKWTDEEFDLTCFSTEMLDNELIPLTEEELSRVPEMKHGVCQTAAPGLRPKMATA